MYLQLDTASIKRKLIFIPIIRLNELIEKNKLLIDCCEQSIPDKYQRPIEDKLLLIRSALSGNCHQV